MADVSRSTINRFERDSHWPDQPETVVGAYASVAGFDSRRIWAKALDLWTQHGADVVLPETDLGTRVLGFEQAADELVAAHLRERASRGATARAGSGTAAVPKHHRQRTPAPR